ncbi:diacylglycerol O-acyltransferase [Mycobacterium sp. 852002-51163_SCH5372311]|uniref:WS/DGAT/MGAT family O-acyltransferase n=1 Tax=Mycobacterium sp. 852002-51163_SCH5372311 TaxID=1834097 RepID=UPI0008008276|nr:wax ester/triacylglycerol synthase family O-acyltransferase [Mycobacterium sp. 852002-51163_SCH5372311]OBF93810.1 diacylglycerol O-acyltransferase [Mycobacterium sp. 852002-51163_SCH5372311]
MKQLTTLDAGFLEVEDSDRHVSLAIGGLAVMEGPAPEYASLVSVLAGRVSEIPRFTQVVHTHLLDLAAPEWVDDAQFNLVHHLHRVGLPEPGDDAMLFRVVAEIMERRLDRDRPLWECWLIEGLAENRWAVLTKLHHCIADGISATHMLAGLCDGADGETFANRIRAANRSPALRPSGPSLNPLDWVGGISHFSAAVTGAAARLATGAVQIVAGLASPVDSSLVGPVSNLRRYSAAQVRLADVATVCHKFDVTINDVALAGITDSFRAMLIHRGEHPRRNALRTLVPVSVRSADALDKLDNRVSLMLPRLPIELEDPVEQLQAVHRRLARVKSSGQRQAGSAFFAAANHIPFALTAWAVRLLSRLPQLGIVALATNVPGPRRQVRMMGRNVQRLLPIPPIALHLRTGIAMLSYGDDLVFGITADYDAVPDVDELAAGIERAVARLVAISAGTG